MEHSVNFICLGVILVLYVGIDVAKHKHDLAVIDTEGKIFIRHLQIENNREG